MAVFSCTVNPSPHRRSIVAAIHPHIRRKPCVNGHIITHVQNTTALLHWKLNKHSFAVCYWQQGFQYVTVIIITVVYYAVAAQQQSNETKITIYRLNLQNRNLSTITCSINKMFPHARLDSILTKIQRWNVVFLGRIITTLFLFILAKVAIIILSEFRALFQNKMIL